MLVYQKPLATKLYLPEIPADYVERTGLYARLNEGLRQTLTSVCAPAGYGKTSLIAGWLRSKQGPDAEGISSPGCAWYTIDETDDLSRFVTYFVSAIRTLHPDFYPDWVEPEQRIVTVAIENEAWGLVNACTTLPSKFVLVLDDYQFIQDQNVHRLLGYFIKHLPTRLHLVLISRSEPPPEIGLAHLRARNRLNEFTRSDLALSRDEAMVFMTSNLPGGIDEQLLDSIWQRTEGWGVGLRLASLSLRSSREPQSFVERFNQFVDRNVTTFLFEQVLSQQTPEMNDFLLTSSVLERFNDESLAALTGALRPATYAMLEEIAANSLFVVPLDDFGNWYRYHSQFRSMLQTRLALRLTADEIRGLHQRAAVWLQANGFLDEALPHFFAADNPEGAADMVEREIPRIMKLERVEQLRRLLDQLPEDVVDRRPRLLLGRAWQHVFHLAYRRLPSLIDRAEAALAESALNPAEMRELQAQILTLRSVPGLGLPDEAALRNMEAALELMTDDQTWFRAWFFNFYGQRLTGSGQYDRTVEVLKAEILQSPTRASTHMARLLFALGVAHFTGGSLQALRDLAQDVNEVGNAMGLPALVVWAEFSLAICDWENDIPTAVYRFERVIQQHQAAQFHALIYASNFLLPIYAREGRLEEGKKVLDLLRHQVTLSYDAHLIEELQALQAVWDLMTGDAPAAEHWADRLGDSHATPMLSIRGVSLAYILIRLGRPDTLQRAVRVLAGIEAQYRAQHHTRGLIGTLVLAAQAQWLLNDRQEAMNVLSEALEIGYPLGYRKTLTTEWISQQAIFDKLASEPHLPPVMLEGLAPAPALAPAAADRRIPELRDVQQDAPENESEVLSYRELEILHLMGRGLSNRDIGSILFISENTVRSHARRIFEKVGARSRGEAVFRAQQLGLLAIDSPPV